MPIPWLILWNGPHLPFRKNLPFWPGPQKRPLQGWRCHWATKTLWRNLGSCNGVVSWNKNYCKPLVDLGGLDDLDDLKIFIGLLRLGGLGFIDDLYIGYYSSFVAIYRWVLKGITGCWLGFVDGHLMGITYLFVQKRYCIFAWYTTLPPIIT